MKTKHTPGPWGQEAAMSSDYQFIRYISGENGEFVANVCAPNGRVEQDETLANAHLIAAAPELLEACEYVARWHREHDSGEGELFGLDFVTTCIAAIRKAKGE